MPTQNDACLIYARMSLDSPLGVERQLEDCRALAAREGWPVAGEYVDDGKSATNGRPRPAYLRLLADAQAGKGTRVIAWDQDRLLRDPDERGPWVKLADAGRVQVFNAAGVELTADPFTFGVKALVAENEVRQMKKRLRRSLVQRAAMGKAHGPVRYGWTVDLIEAGKGKNGKPRRVRLGADQIDPVAAGVIREAAAGLLAGDSLYAVTQRLNAAGAVTATGRKWSPTQLRAVLLRPRNAGLVTHRGQVVQGATGDWPPILDVDTFDRITALLTDPTRVTNGGARPRWLLSILGSVTCGKCGGAMVCNTGGRTRNPAYTCRECHGVSRSQPPVDRMVEMAAVRRLMMPDALAALTPEADPAQRAALLAEADTLRARLDLAADQYADGNLTAEQLARITARLQPQIDAAQAAVAALAPRADLTPMAGPDAAERWKAAPLDVKRAVIDTLLTVVILPEAPKGRAPFNPDSVRIEWK